MPPHCDSLDGPVVRAARQALEARNVDLILPFVPRDGEDPVAEQAVQTGSPRDLLELLTTIVSEEVWRRFARLSELVRHTSGDVETMRPYVQARLDLEVWAHGVYLAAKADPHGEVPAPVYAATEAYVAD